MKAADLLIESGCQNYRSGRLELVLQHTLHGRPETKCKSCFKFGIRDHTLCLSIYHQLSARCIYAESSPIRPLLSSWEPRPHTSSPITLIGGCRIHHKRTHEPSK